VNWFRKYVKSGSRLALLALAIQFTLSFGHFHGEVASAAPAVQAALADAALQPPADHDSDRHSADCAICAVLSLANHFLLTTPPHLDLPQAVGLPRLASGAEFTHPGSPHPAFRSRAPPVS
jgi:hypothetical protein